MSLGGKHADYIQQETITGTVPMLTNERKYSFWDLFLSTSGFLYTGRVRGGVSDV